MHTYTAPKSTNESQAHNYLLTAPEPARGRKICKLSTYIRRIFGESFVGLDSSSHR